MLERLATLFVGAAVAVAAISCAPSEQEIKREFSGFVAEHQRCEADSDCALVSTGCPLGCAVAVQVAAAGETQQLARELIEDYESGGRACQYDCAVVCGAGCRDNACMVVMPLSPSEPECPR